MKGFTHITCANSFTTHIHSLIVTLKWFLEYPRGRISKHIINSTQSKDWLYLSIYWDAWSIQKALKFTSKALIHEKWNKLIEALKKVTYFTLSKFRPIRLPPSWPVQSKYTLQTMSISQNHNNDQRQNINLSLYFKNQNASDVYLPIIS